MTTGRRQRRRRCAGSEEDAGEDTAAEATTDVEAARVVLATQGITSASDEDLVYFTEVQRAFDLFGSAAAGADQESREGDTRSAFFQGLLNRGVGTAFVPVLEALQMLEPTAHYAEDHRYLVTQVERLVAIDAEIREAVLAEDLGAFLFLNAQLARTSTEAALRLQPNLCRTVSRGGANCASYEVNYDNEYAVALRGISARLQGAIAATDQAVAGPDGDFQLGNLGPGEWAGLIATLFGELSTSQGEAIAALRALEPPQEFSADHGRLIAQVTAERVISTSIAADAKDGTLQALRFDDAQIEDLGRGACVAFSEMSEEFRQVALLIGPGGDDDSEGDCEEVGG